MVCNFYPFKNKNFSWHFRTVEVGYWRALREVGSERWSSYRVVTSLYLELTTASKVYVVCVFVYVCVPFLLVTTFQPSGC